MNFNNLIIRSGFLMACLMVSGAVQSEANNLLYTNDSAQSANLILTVFRPDLPSMHASPRVQLIRTGGLYSRAADNRAQLDMVDTALASGNFNYLIAAARQAGMLDILREDGPYTLFAPTDDAFAKLPKDQLIDLMRSRKALGRILTYHVVSGIMTSTEIMQMSSIASVHGGQIIIQSGEQVRVNNAKIIAADIPTRNGIIHVIDKVMLPPEMMSMN